MTTELTVTTPFPAYDFQAIENAGLAESTQKQYKKAITNYLDTGASPGDAIALAEYSQGINRSSRSFLKAAIRLMAAGLANDLKGGATPDNIAQVQAALYRLEAIQTAVKVSTAKGEKAHA